MTETDDTVWITVPDSIPESEWYSIQSQLRDVFPESDILITNDGINTIDSEEAHEIADKLVNALEG